MVIIYKMGGHSSTFLMFFSFSAHELGQVKCGSCAVLLMYQFGASSVRCSSCCFVTEIGVSVILLQKLLGVYDLGIISQFFFFYFIFIFIFFITMMVWLGLILDHHVLNREEIGVNANFVNIINCFVKCSCRKSELRCWLSLESTISRNYHS